MVNIIPIDNNELSDRADLALMITDPARKRKTDPGNPEIARYGIIIKPSV